MFYNIRVTRIYIYIYLKYFNTHKLIFFLPEAAKKCPYFHGPQDRTIFKEEILEVLRAVKQRYRNKRKKSMNDERDEESDLHGDESLGSTDYETDL